MNKKQRQTYIRSLYDDAQYHFNQANSYLIQWMVHGMSGDYAEFVKYKENGYKRLQEARRLAGEVSPNT